MLHSCSNPWKTQQIFEPALKKVSFGFRFRVFCDWRYKWSSFRPFGSISSGLGPKPLDGDGNISLKFLLETWLESKSFEPLIDFPRFWVWRLWLKSKKLIHWLDSSVVTVEPEMLESWSKARKDLNYSLVSNKNLRFPSCNWAQCQVTSAKMAKNLLHFWRHPQKTETKNCFFFAN